MSQSLLQIIERETSATRRLETRQGASACLVEEEGQESLQLRDAEDRILFEYRPDTGHCVLTVPSGDLALRAPEGNIELVSGKGIRCRGRSVNLSATGARGTAPSALSIEPDAVRLSGASLEVAADHADLLVSEGRYQGLRLTIRAEQVKQVYGKLETVATRIVERATDIYRQVDNLSQLKAGRLRTLVKGACHIKGGHTSIKAEEDVKINGKRINLG